MQKPRPIFIRLLVAALSLIIVMPLMAAGPGLLLLSFSPTRTDYGSGDPAVAIITIAGLGMTAVSYFIGYLLYDCLTDANKHAH